MSKAYARINEIKRKLGAMRLCISLEVISLNEEGFVMNDNSFFYAEYLAPENCEDCNYKVKLTLINPSKISLKISWLSSSNEVIDNEHIINLEDFEKVKNVKLDGLYVHRLSLFFP